MRSSALSRRYGCVCICMLAVGLGVGVGAGCKRSSTSADVVTPAVKSLVLATTSEPESLNPLVSDGAVAVELQALTSRELTVLDASWHLQPDLAVRVPTLESGDAHVDTQDGHSTLVVTWHLRPDADWQDGAPVIADDFILAWQLQLDDTQGLTNTSTAKHIARMERGVDDKTLIVTWKAPEPGFAMTRVHRALPAHILRARLDDHGHFTSLARDPIGRAPLSNGPFVLTQWLPGQALVYARNPHAHPAPLLDALTVKILPSTSSLGTALVSGDVDVALPGAGLSVPEVLALSAQHPALHVTRAPGLVWGHLDFNLDDVTLQDVRVRAAIAAAIDRPALVHALYGDSYELADSYLPRTHPLSSTIVPMVFDRARADSLLDAAGWTRKTPGAVREKDGKPLVLELAAASGTTDGTQLVTLVQSDLRKVGVDVRIDLRPFAVFFGENARHRTLPHLAFYAWTLDPTSTGCALFCSDRIPSEANHFRGQNFPGLRDDDVTAWLSAADASLDNGVRKSLVAQAQARIATLVPVVPLYFRPVLVASSARVTGLAPSGTLTPVTAGAVLWDVAR